MDDFDLAFGNDEPSQDNSGEAGNGNQGDQGGGASPPAVEASKEAKQEDGTTAEAEGAATPPTEEEKGAYPKELEPYKDLLESRKWDPKNPEFTPTVLKSYKEAEAYAKRRETENKLIQSKVEQREAMLRGDVDSINRYRKAQGLAPIKADVRTPEQKAQEVNTLIESVNKALRGDETALEQLNDMLTKQRDDVEFERRMSGQTGIVTPEAAFEKRKTDASRNFGAFAQANPEAAKHIDELTDLFSPGGVFDAMGIDYLDIAATPERLASLAEIGQHIHVSKNIDKIVEARVKSELERRRMAGNSAGAGQQPKGGASKQNANEHELSPVEAAFF
jgi:hypothetical protein